MLKDRKLRIAWRAYLAELEVMQRLERPSEAVIAERFRGYFRWRLEEALDSLWFDSELLAEVLEEIFLIATDDDEIINWRPPALEDMISRIGEPLGSATSAHK
jgi:hypothetical protein